MGVNLHNIWDYLENQGHRSKVKVSEAKKTSLSVHFPGQTLSDGDDDCKANPFVFIITISALAHILPAKCLLYMVYFDIRFQLRVVSL